MSISIQRILFATDFSEPARNAQQFAVAFSEKFGAQLHVLHCVSEEALVPAPDLAAEWLHAEVNRARQQLTKEIGGTCSARLEVRPGNPVQEIIRYAGEMAIDLIVIGTHGRSGLSHVLLGSVAEKVVRLATCPVLTVHPQNHSFVMSK